MKTGLLSKSLLKSAAMSYRLLLFDLDGTLLNPQREIFARNIDVMRRLMSRGIRVGLATGRTLRSVAPYVQALQPNGPLILFNGARVWDGAKYVYERNVALSDALDALRLVRHFDDVHVNLYVGDEIYIRERTVRSVESEVKDGVPHTVVGDLAGWLGSRIEDPVKMMLIGNPEDLERFRTLYSRRSRACTFLRSEWNYLEIMAEGVTKGHALDVIESEYGIGCGEIVGFGDNLNDVTLIQRCGMGVAMGNSHPELAALANRVIGHHDTEAIADFLGEVFPS
jgi:Cof subfamily protein (haloacid dehalogenase superfamily)